MNPSLFEKVAARLTGRYVSVKFTRRLPAGYDGEARKMGSSEMIFLASKSEGDNLLRVFLHEAAYVKASWPQLMDFDFEQPPGRKELTSWEIHEILTSPAGRVRETAADELAARWLTWADENYWKYGDVNTPILARKLRALEQFNGE